MVEVYFVETLWNKCLIIKLDFLRSLFLVVDFNCSFMHLIEHMKIPRKIVTNNFVGRTIGKPYYLSNETNVVRQCIELLSSSTIQNSIKII